MNERRFKQHFGLLLHFYLKGNEMGVNIAVRDLNTLYQERKIKEAIEGQ